MSARPHHARTFRRRVPSPREANRPQNDGRGCGPAAPAERRSGRRRRRATSKHRTAAAMATLRLSARPTCGMVTVPSTGTPAGIPWASLPEHQRRRGGSRAASSYGTPPVRRRGPAAARRAREASAGATSTTTGTWNSAPAEARTTLGLNGSTVPSSEHDAERRPRPRRPAGSCRGCPGRPRPAATTTEPVTADASGTSHRRAIASTGCGVTVEATRSSTPGASSRTGTPAGTSSAADTWSSRPARRTRPRAPRRRPPPRRAARGPR